MEETQMKLISKMQAKRAELWVAACIFDGIDPQSKFVVFSNGNKAAERYNRIVIMQMQKVVR
jgi:hypothetical protein